MLFSSFSALSDPTGVPLGTNNPTCDNDTLGTYGPSAELEADWTPNPIELHWYDGETEINVQNTSAASCTYDELIVPATTPSKTGYTFGGWKLKPPCLISSTLVNTNGNHLYSHCATNSTVYYDFPDLCHFDNAFYNTDNCSGTPVAGIALFGWKTTWANGDVIVGESLCSDTRGRYLDIGTPDSIDGGYCWCKVKSYTANGAQQCNVSSSSWVIVMDEDDGYQICINGCADLCARYVRDNSAFRAAMFTGILAQ